MPFFDKFSKKEQLISRTLEIDESLYIELERLSKTVYDASINKLVNAAIQEIIETENVNLYEKDRRTSYVARSFLIKSSYLDKLYELKEKYGVPIRLLVNIAVRNALMEEKALEQVNARWC